VESYLVAPHSKEGEIHLNNEVSSDPFECSSARNCIYNLGDDPLSSKTGLAFISFQFCRSSKLKALSSILAFWRARSFTHLFCLQDDDSEIDLDTV
jgi:hypothetical protein